MSYSMIGAAMLSICRPTIIIASVIGMYGLILTSKQILITSSCMSAPYLYVTVHDDIHNVLKYSRDGCLLESNVLSGGNLAHAELRGVKLGTYEEKEALYVADANTGSSQVLIYGGCNFQGVRSYRATVTDTDMNPGADHAYGIAFDRNGNIYVSFQHTDVVIRFYKDSLRAMPFPSAINYRAGSYYQGTFLQFGKTGEHSDNLQGIRSIVFAADDYLWVANEDINGVVVVDSNGRIIHTVDVDTPVGLYYDSNFDMVFIASKSVYGAVYGVNPRTYKVVKIYYIDGMEHPTGMTSYGNTLYIAEQCLGVILTFNIDTTKFIAIVGTGFPGKVEQITLSPC